MQTEVVQTLDSSIAFSQASSRALSAALSTPVPPGDEDHITVRHVLELSVREQAETASIGPFHACGGADERHGGAGYPTQHLKGANCVKGCQPVEDRDTDQHARSLLRRVVAR